VQFALRDYQQAAVDDGVQVLSRRLPAPLYVAPTGAGKGVCLAGLLQRLPDLLCVVPNLPIALGVYAKLTGDTGVWDRAEAKQRAACEAARIWTEKRALAAARNGTLGWAGRVVFDEAHHGPADTTRSLLDLLGTPPYAGYTGTPYRGTPGGTADLRTMYPGGIVTVLGLKAAIDARFVSLPTFRTLPLLDDEEIDVKDGEFVIKSVESAIGTRVGQLVEHMESQYDRAAGLWSRPTTVVLPGLGGVEIVRQALEEAGLPTATVVADTRNRSAVFSQTLSRRVVLLQVRAVGEGVDLALRTMYDLSPTMSPTLWRQRVGRIMRPVDVRLCERCEGNGAVGSSLCTACRDGVVTEPPPTYFSCCHNLLRHGYLFEGIIPRAAFTEARTAWGDDWKPSRRTMSRALGNTGFGRFAPTEVPLADGGVAFLYALKAPTGLDSYAAVLLPHHPQPAYFHRKDALTGREAEFSPKPGVVVKYPEKEYGKWAAIPAMPELTGCLSYPPDPIGPKALDWWKKDAARVGLDPDHTPDRKQFALLPILVNTRSKFR
jgi:superfamily II DNA or RNA helicase